MWQLSSISTEYVSMSDMQSCIILIHHSWYLYHEDFFFFAKPNPPLSSLLTIMFWVFSYRVHSIKSYMVDMVEDKVINIYDSCNRIEYIFKNYFCTSNSNYKILYKQSGPERTQHIRSMILRKRRDRMKKLCALLRLKFVSQQDDTKIINFDEGVLILWPFFWGNVIFQSLPLLSQKLQLTDRKCSIVWLPREKCQSALALKSEDSKSKSKSKRSANITPILKRQNDQLV